MNKISLAFLLMLSVGVAFAGNTVTNLNTGTVTYTDTTTPSTPTAGKDKCYVKSDHNFYCLNPSGTEVQIGGTLPLSSANIFVGNVSNVAAAVAMTGDVAITNAGVTSFVGNLTGDVTSSGKTTSISGLTRSKLAAGSINQVVINDGSGNLTSEATLAKTRGGTAQDNSSLTFPSSGTVPAYTPTNHGVVISGSGAAAVVTSAGTSLQVLTSNGPSADPTFQTAPVSTTLTTKGDVQTFSTVNARQPVPGDYGMLVPDSAQTTGWRNADYLSRIRGDSQKNYIQYNDFENGAATGWSLGHVTLTNGIPTGTPTFGSGASGNLSLSASNTTPISGGFSGVVTSVAATTVGDFVSTSALPIDIKGRAKSLQFKIDYAVSNGGNGNFSGTLNNTYGYAVYDVTNSAWLSCTGQFNFVSNVAVGNGSYPASGNCQTNSNTASVRVVVYNVAASAGAITLQLDDAYFGPQITAAGAARTDLVQYTPIFTGFGTVTSPSCWWARDGDSVELNFTFTSGTSTATPGLISMPPGLVVDSVKVNTPMILGDGAQSGATASQYKLKVTGGLSTVEVTTQTGSTGALTSTNASSLIATGQIITVHARVPVAGWYSNTAMSNDAITTLIQANADTSSQNLSTSVPTTIIFTNRPNDTNAAYSTSTGLYTAPESGYLTVSSSITVGSGSGINNVNVPFSIIKNGSIVAGATVTGQFAASTNGSFNLNISRSVKVSANDTIGVQAGGTAAWSGTGSVSNAGISFVYSTGIATVGAADTVAARYFASATTISGTLATVVWTTKDFDTTNSMSSGVYSCPISGKYQVNANVQTGGTIALNSSVDMQLQKNGTVISEDQSYAGGSMTAQNGKIVDEISCLPNDQIRIQLSSSATGPSITASNTKVFFSIARVGN